MQPLTIPQSCQEKVFIQKNKNNKYKNTNYKQIDTREQIRKLIAKGYDLFINLCDGPLNDPGLKYHQN